MGEDGVLAEYLVSANNNHNLKPAKNDAKNMNGSKHTIYV